MDELDEIFTRLQNSNSSKVEAEKIEKIAKLDESDKTDRIIRSNETAGVPKRFCNVRFSDYPTDFTEKAKELCLSKNTDHILLLFGNTGMGKTTLMCSAIHERAYVGLNGSKYYKMLNLEMDLRRCRNFQNEDDERKFIDELSNIPFLCIDEVGACLDRREEAYFLQRVVCQRYDNKLPTWIATNLLPSQFKALLCNVSLEGKSRQEIQDLCERLDKENAVLNRIKSVIVTHRMVGESFRGGNDNDRANV